MGQILFQATLGGQVAVAGPNTASSFTLTLPAATDTLVGKATTDTLTNKSISGSTNTLTNIANASLTNSNVTIGSTAISLGGTSTTLAGLTGITSSAITDTGLTSGRVTYAGASGLLSDSAGLTFDGTNLTTTGTATATRFIPSGSTVATNGMYLPAANTLGFSTNSTQRITILSNGFVGINNSSPAVQFDVDGIGYFRNLLYVSGAQGISSDGASPILFKINNVEKMTLTSAGLVGIGTSSPLAKLDVYGGSANTSISVRTDSFDGTYYAALDFSTGGQGANYQQAQIKAVGANNYSANLIFSTQNSGTTNPLVERMRIDSSGNLGLGVTPQTWSSSFKPAFQFGTTGSLLNGSGYTMLSNNWYQDATGTDKYIASNYATNYYQNAGAHVWRTAPSGTAGNAITFTQAMTLDTSGNLLVGTTASIAKFVVDGTTYLSSTVGIATTRTTGKLNIDANINSENGIDIQSLQSPAGGSYIIFRNSSGTAAGSITHISSTAVLYNTTSDQRVKTNIIDAPLGNIDDIKVRSFDWIADGGHQKYGMIAQELVTVAPYAVYQPENPDEMMGVDYSKLVPMMIKEIQDLKAEVNQLKTKIGV